MAVVDGDEKGTRRHAQHRLQSLGGRDGVGVGGRGEHSTWVGSRKDVRRRPHHRIPTVRLVTGEEPIQGQWPHPPGAWVTAERGPPQWNHIEVCSPCHGRFDQRTGAYTGLSAEYNGAPFSMTGNLQDVIEMCELAIPADKTDWRRRLVKRVVKRVVKHGGHAAGVRPFQIVEPPRRAHRVCRWHDGLGTKVVGDWHHKRRGRRSQQQYICLAASHRCVSVPSRQPLADVPPTCRSPRSPSVSSISSVSFADQRSDQWRHHLGNLPVWSRYNWQHRSGLSRGKCWSPLAAKPEPSVTG